MNIDVTSTPQELARLDVSGSIVVAIDVVRATTTIATGLAHGARSFRPVASLAEARRAKVDIGNAMTLLGGECWGRRPAGFDLGNSPSDYTVERVAGRDIVFTTTNGTRVIRAAQGASEVVTGAFVNLDAICRYLIERRTRVILASAGKENRPGLDDLTCAGMFVTRLLELLSDSGVRSDAARAAQATADRYSNDLLATLMVSAAGIALLSVGLEHDLEYCAQLSVLDVVPVLRGGMIVPS